MYKKMYMYHFNETSRTTVEIPFEDMETYEPQAHVSSSNVAPKNELESPKEYFVRTFLNAQIENIKNPGKNSAAIVIDDDDNQNTIPQDNTQQPTLDFQTRLNNLLSENIASPFDVLKDVQPENNFEHSQKNQLQYNELPFFEHFSMQQDQYNNILSAPEAENDESEEMERIFSLFNPNG